MEQEVVSEVQSNLSFGSLFSKTFNEFINKFKIIWKSFFFLYLLPIIVLIVVIVLVMIITFPFITISGNSIADFASDAVGLVIGEELPVGGVTLAIFFVVFVIIIVILTVLLSLSYFHVGLSEEDEPDFSFIFDKTKQTFWKFFGLCIFMCFVLFILFCLFIIPGVIFLVFWIFATYILIDRNTRVFTSLNESRQLVKGRWWRVFGYSLLIGFITGIVGFVLGLIPVFGLIVSPLITTPFAILFMKNFYLDLKKDMVEKEEI